MAAALLTLSGCSATGSRADSTADPTGTTSSAGETAQPASPSSGTPASASGSGDGQVEHVVLVSVDGLNPEAIRRLGPAGAPTFHRLMAEGASTLDARTLVEQTRTLPNHTGMVTGRPVEGASGHRVTFNEDNGGSLQQTAGTYCASIFDVVHDNGGTTALYAGKEKFDYLDRSWDGRHGAPDTTGPDDGRDKIDTYLRADSPELRTALVEALRTDPPEFSMIHFRDPDENGHARGWLSDAYLAAVQATDALIGDLLDAITGDTTLASSTVVIVTADHGGEGRDHANPTKPADYTIPFFAWGTGVAAGADLYALNPDRGSPGASRPDYSATPPPVRNGEVGNLAADLLGLPAIPGSQVNADQSLDLR